MSGATSLPSPAEIAASIDLEFCEVAGCFPDQPAVGPCCRCKRVRARIAQAVAADRERSRATGSRPPATSTLAALDQKHELEELKDLVYLSIAANPPPWTAHPEYDDYGHDTPYCTITHPGDSVVCAGAMLETNDAALIAAARNALPGLFARLSAAADLEAMLCERLGLGPVGLGQVGGEAFARLVAERLDQLQAARDAYCVDQVKRAQHRAAKLEVALREVSAFARGLNAAEEERAKKMGAGGFPVTDADIDAFMAAHAPTAEDRAAADRVWKKIETQRRAERAGRRVVAALWVADELAHIVRSYDAGHDAHESGRPRSDAERLFARAAEKHGDRRGPFADWLFNAERMWLEGWDCGEAMRLQFAAEREQDAARST